MQLLAYEVLKNGAFTPRKAAAGAARCRVAPHRTNHYATTVIETSEQIVWLLNESKFNEDFNRFLNGKRFE